MIKSYRILSSQVPGINEKIRECINKGQWLLFKSNEFGLNSDAPYFLKTGSKIYKLDNHGALLEQVSEQNHTIDVDEVFYFSDVPNPVSLSNASYKFT